MTWARSTAPLRPSSWSPFRALPASWTSAASSCGHCARCDETGTLLVYDEIQTGMGRLGRPLAAGDFGVTPDLATLAKGIANGMPMAAVLIGDSLAAKIKTGDMASTFGGGPVACAAHLAVLETIERENPLTPTQKLGEAIHQQLGVGPGRGDSWPRLPHRPARPRRCEGAAPPPDGPRLHHRHQRQPPGAAADAADQHAARGRGGTRRGVERNVT